MTQSSHNALKKEITSKVILLLRLDVTSQQYVESELLKTKRSDNKLHLPSQGLNLSQVPLGLLPHGLVPGLQHPRIRRSGACMTLNEACKPRNQGKFCQCCGPSKTGTSTRRQVGYSTSPGGKAVPSSDLGRHENLHFQTLPEVTKIKVL